MPGIYLSIEGRQQGPYTQEQLKELLSSGQLSDDLPAWHAGLTDWVPIKDILQMSKKIEVETAALPPIPMHVIHTTERLPGQQKLMNSSWITVRRLALLAGGLTFVIFGLACAATIVLLTVSNSPANSITEVLRQDDALSKSYEAEVTTLKSRNLSPDDYCDQQAQLIQALVTDMRNIDTQNCPSPFRETYNNHIQCWSRFGTTFSSHPHLTSDDEAAFGSILVAAVGGNSGDLLNYASDATQQNNSFLSELKESHLGIQNSWNDVQNLASQYGVKPNDYSEN